jgi:hypothetical protein
MHDRKSVSLSLFGTVKLLACKCDECHPPKQSFLLSIAYCSHRTYHSVCLLTMQRSRRNRNADVDSSVLLVQRFSDSLPGIENLVHSKGPPLWSSGQSSWLQIRRPGFDSRHYQKKKSNGSGTGSTQPREYN